MNHSVNYPLNRRIIEKLDELVEPKEKPHPVRRYIRDRVNNIKEYVGARRQMRQNVLLRNNQLRQQLRDAGLRPVDMMRSETFHLGDVLFADERIVSAVSGRIKDGGMMLLLVTNNRIVCINHIPLFTDMDEFGYSTISGVSLEMGRWSATVTLYAAIGEFTIRTTNLEAAKRFVDAVERVAIEVQQLTTRPLVPLKF